MTYLLTLSHFQLYQGLIKKLKKELGERKSPSIDLIRRLLPLPKVQAEVIVCESAGAHAPDSRAGGNTHKNTSDAPDSRKQGGGLVISKKERVSPWEILEGHKNLAPFNLAWFGAVRIERKPLKFEEQHRLLLYHTHATKRPASYYLEPPVLPPEILEPQTDKLDAKVSLGTVNLTYHIAQQNGL